MGAIQNGMAYYGGIIPYSATFLAFLDYMRPPVRLAALAASAHRSMYSPTIRSSSARTAPRTSRWNTSPQRGPSRTCNVIRPADAEETKEAWLAALARDEGPHHALAHAAGPAPARRAEPAMGRTFSTRAPTS